MSSRAGERVVWLYSGEHLEHPFIGLAADSLKNAGYSVSVVDAVDRVGRTEYEHVPLGLRGPKNPDHDAYGPSETDQEDGRSRRSRPSRLTRLLGLLSLTMRRLLPDRFRPPFKKSWSRLWLFPLTIVEATIRRPHVVIASLPDGVLAGHFISILSGARLVYYPFELYGEQHFKVPAIWQKLERYVLRNGIDALVTQNEERAKVYLQERGSRVAPKIVHNYKPRQAVRRSGDLRRRLKLDDKCRIVLYEGLLLPGRWLDQLVRSAAYLPADTKLVFMARKSPWWEESIGPLLKMPGVGERVLEAPWVDPRELLSYVACADAGVIIYDDQVRNNYLCEPTKLSEYVIAGVPVVAPSFPTIAPVIQRYEIGSTFAGPEPAEIARAINYVLSVPRHIWKTNISKAREDLVWETQLPKFLEAVDG